MQQRVIIRGQLPKMNEMINDARTHWSVSSKNKKLATDIVRLSVSRMKTIQYPCTMSFEWYISTNHDPDNIAGGGRKSFLDGLQEAGKLVNDNQKWILGFEDMFYKCKKGDDRVEVIIAEYEP